MLKQKIMATALGVAFSLSAIGVANAAPVIYNLSLSNISTFDNTITGTGSTVVTSQVVIGQSVYNYTDKNGNPATVTITRPNSSTPYGADNTYGTLSGAVWGISPDQTSGEPIPGMYSGIKFAFSSPVNAFGFEIGDWATCCMANPRPSNIQSTYGVPEFGSGLWIAFDGGAATLPANALSADDNPGYVESSEYENFIGAIDSSGFFSTVTFFGDGFGEYLVAGGTLRFASVPEGSVGVPEPASLALMGLGLAGLAALRRRRQH